MFLELYVLGTSTLFLLGGLLCLLPYDWTRMVGIALMCSTTLVVARCIMYPVMYNVRYMTVY